MGFLIAGQLKSNYLQAATTDAISLMCMSRFTLDNRSEKTRKKVISSHLQPYNFMIFTATFVQLLGEEIK